MFKIEGSLGSFSQFSKKYWRRPTSGNVWNSFGGNKPLIAGCVCEYISGPRISRFCWETELDKFLPLAAAALEKKSPHPLPLVLLPCWFPSRGPDRKGWLEFSLEEKVVFFCCKPVKIDFDFCLALVNLINFFSNFSPNR